MNTRISTVAIAIIATMASLVAAPSFAGIGDEEKVAYYFKASAEDKMAMVVLQNLHGAKVELKIQDLDGYVLFNTRIKERNTIIQRFDMTPLVDGTYRLLVSVDGNEQIEPFQIKGSKVLINPVEETTEEELIFRLTEKNLYIFMENINQEKVSVEITDYAGNTIYNGTFEGQDQFLKLFNLNRLSRGEYQVTLKKGENVVYRDISLN